MVRTLHRFRETNVEEKKSAYEPPHSPRTERIARWVFWMVTLLVTVAIIAGDLLAS